MSEPIIQVKNLTKQYRIGSKEQGSKTFREAIIDAIKSPFNNIKALRKLTEFDNSSCTNDEEDIIWALKDVSFDVNEGEVVGIIGKNGAGKSTLLKILSRITDPTSGQIKIRGRVSSLLEVGTGFHPELTGRENIFLNGAILGMRKEEINRKFDEIAAFAEIEKFLDTPVKRYSSGMYVRLAFAVAAHLEPEILIIDEVLAVGDVEFQKKCLGKMGAVAKGGRTVLFVSHNMGAIQQLTQRSILLNDGKLAMSSDTYKVVETYLVRDRDLEINTSLRTNEDDFKVNSIKFNYDALESGFNKPLWFDLTLSLEKNKYDVLFGFAIVNSIGAKIMTSECVIGRLSSGRVNLSLILKDHRLPPGNYSFNLGIGASGSQILYQENVLIFEISDLNIDNPVLTLKRDRIGVYLPCQWVLK